MKLITGLLAAACAFAQLPPGEITMGHLHLTVSDPQAHKKLWIGVLGAQEVHAGSIPLLKLPDVIVALTGGTPVGGTDDSAVNHLGFLVKDLAAMKEKLTAAGGQVVREMPDTKQMFVMFPDGIKVEFTQDATLTIPVKHHHIHFFTHDLEATRAWYVKHFGAKPGKRGRFEAADLPGVNLSFSATDAPTAATRGRAMDHIGFEIKNLEAFCKKLEAQGVKFDRPYRYYDAYGLGVAFLTDPFGVKVELTEGLAGL